MYASAAVGMGPLPGVAKYFADWVRNVIISEKVEREDAMFRRVGADFSSQVAVYVFQMAEGSE